MLNRSFVLVDDDADDAAIFYEALNQIGSDIKFHTAENGLRLFELLLEYTPDVIFLDINMPKMGGWETLRRLKGSSEYNNIPVIMYSTSSAKKDIDLAYSLGAVLFITKPEDFRKLVKILGIIAEGLQAAQISSLKDLTNVRIN